MVVDLNVHYYTAPFHNFLTANVLPVILNTFSQQHVCVLVLLFYNFLECQSLNRKL